MASIREKKGILFIDFTFKDKRYRISLGIRNTAQNRKIAKTKLHLLESFIESVNLGITPPVTLEEIFPNYDFNKNKKNKDIEYENNATDTVEASYELSGKLFSEVFLSWLDNKIGLAKSTYRTWKNFYKNYYEPFLGDKQIKEISEDDIKRMFRYMQSKMKNSVINKKICTLKCFFKELHEDGIISQNPLRRIRRLKENKPDISPFTQEELKKLLEGFKKYYPHYYNFVAFLAFTGCRPNEAVALKWKYIDWDNRKILIREGFVLGETTTLKTASSRRDIDMTDNLLLLLKHQHQKTYEINQEYVFINQLGKRICWENFRQKYHKVIKKIGIPPRPIYQLRHTFASLALKSGEDPTWVSRTLGHSSLRMTLEVYNRYIPSLNKDGKHISSVFGKIINEQEEK